jgi:hypothetical protein
MYLSGASLPVQALAFFAGGMKDPGLMARLHLRVQLPVELALTRV